MRTAGVLFYLLVIAAGAAACNNKGDASPSPDPAAIKAQQDLVARRDAIMPQRQALQSERDKIDAEIEKEKAGGRDTTELEKKKAAIDTQIESQSSDLTSLTTKIDQVVARGDQAAGMASREASMGSREKSMASREEKLAERERLLAQRERDLAQREKETCSGGGTPMIIQAPSGGKYDKSDVQPLLNKAKGLMTRKGILTADLPSGAQNLESDATKAMNDRDWSKAYIYAAQLYNIVEGIKVDRAFIQAKMTRINKQLGATRVDDATNTKLAQILQDVAQKFGDGNYAAANSKLNSVASELR
jgi:hypothetical protein